MGMQRPNKIRRRNISSLSTARMSFLQKLNEKKTAELAELQLHSMESAARKARSFSQTSSRLAGSVAWSSPSDSAHPSGQPSAGRPSSTAPNTVTAHQSSPAQLVVPIQPTVFAVANATLSCQYSSTSSAKRPLSASEPHLHTHSSLAGHTGSMQSLRKPTSGSVRPSTAGQQPPATGPLAGKLMSIATATDVALLLEELDMVLCHVSKAIEGYDDDVRLRLCQRVKIQDVAKNDILYHEGEHADKMYVILAGTIYCMGHQSSLSNRSSAHMHAQWLHKVPQHHIYSVLKE